MSGAIFSLLALLIAGAVVIFGMYCLNTWLAKRDQARMVQDIAFEKWLARVDARLRQYGSNENERSQADWLIDFESGLSPDLAAKNMLGASNKAPR